MNRKGLAAARRAASLGAPSLAVGAVCAVTGPETENTPNPANRIMAHQAFWAPAPIRCLYMASPRDGLDSRGGVVGRQLG